MKNAHRSGFKPSLLSELESRFGERVNFDATERHFYSRDMGELPSSMGRLVGGLAQAVVQVEEEEELAWLLEFSARHEVPLTPRAAATSGYGGAIYGRGGIVVDLNRVNRILEINLAGERARVVPRVVWWNLEKELRSRGLALRAYPSSAPSSTVGGWVAVGVGNWRLRLRGHPGRVVGPGGVWASR